MIKKIVGSKNQRMVKKLWPVVQEINRLEEGLQSLSDDDLRAKTAKWKEQLSPIENQDELEVALKKSCPRPLPW